MMIRLVGMLVASLALTALSTPVDAASSRNHAPTVRGSATPVVVAGQMYRFQPTAKDADGDKVTFVIANKPVWAKFDSRTGTLSGTPNATQVGFFKDIEISATDGKAVTSLSTFMIVVKAAAKPVSPPTVSLDWQAPLENTDGSALTNLKGYTLHYGQQSKAYTNTIRIDNPSVLNYVVDGLPKGTYFFALTAFNSHGTESEFSGELTKTVN